MKANAEGLIAAGVPQEKVAAMNRAERRRYTLKGKGRRCTGTPTHVVEWKAAGKVKSVLQHMKCIDVAADMPPEQSKAAVALILLAGKGHKTIWKVARLKNDQIRRDLGPDIESLAALENYLRGANVVIDWSSSGN